MTVDTRARLCAALRGRYRIGPEVGAGGMATVYLAEDVLHARQVAIKVLASQIDRFSAARFIAEIRTTARLQHPNILPLFESGNADGLPYYVAPYIEGGSVRDRLNSRGCYPVSEAVEIVRTVATALHYVHDQGVVHRDIKPDNILMIGEAPVLADFGISSSPRGDPSARLTKPGNSPGSPLYMSPEQLAGEPDLDGRSDIYSLASVLYEMLIGTPPFSAESAQALAVSILCEAPPSPRELRFQIPPCVDQAILRALAKLPSERFPSAREFGAALGNEPTRSSFAETANGEPYGSTAQVALGQ
jgi:serine/threonine protein kinase